MIRVQNACLGCGDIIDMNLRYCYACQMLVDKAAPRDSFGRFMDFLLRAGDNYLLQSDVDILDAYPERRIREDLDRDNEVRRLYRIWKTL